MRGVAVFAAVLQAVVALIVAVDGDLLRSAVIGLGVPLWLILRAVLGLQITVTVNR